MDEEDIWVLGSVECVLGTAEGDEWEPLEKENQREMELTADCNQLWSNYDALRELSS